MTRKTQIGIYTLRKNSAKLNSVSFSHYLRENIQGYPQLGRDQYADTFKEFDSRFKFKPRLKYCWFHLKELSFCHKL